MAKKRKVKSFVYNETIKNNVPGALSRPNEQVICKIGKHKVLVTRNPKLNYYGNPVHVATYINLDGSEGVSYKSDGGCDFAVKGLFKKKGIDVKISKKERLAREKMLKKMKAFDYARQLEKESSRW